MNATIADIEKATQAFSIERGKLVELVGELQIETENLKRRKIGAIRRAVDATAEKRNSLHNLLAESKDLFTKPRSLILHGVRVGYAKSKGKLDWPDGERVAELIRRHVPEQFDDLIQTRHIPIADALSRLDAALLRKIGVSVIEPDDQVVIRPTDSAVDKIVTALLKGAEELEEHSTE